MAGGGTQNIKRGIALRAKYRLDQHKPGPTFKTVLFCQVVPHPCNRGGEPVKSIRTKELTGTVVTVGCDPYEGSSNAVGVWENNDFRSCLETLRWKTFQLNFERQVDQDKHMAKKVHGVPAVVGSLSHSHFLCTLRNIAGGMNGCECSGKQKCTCKSRPILDEDGRYSMSKLKEHDETWHDLVGSGITYELLSAAIDVEESEGDDEEVVAMILLAGLL